MKARSFNSLMHFINEEWAAKVLGMKVLPEGPDLIDNKKIVEVKFSLINIEKKYPLSWTVLEYQMAYPQEFGKMAFWGLGKYWMNESISDITRQEAEDSEFLERMVEKRELYIIKWDWMNQFKPSHVNGQTEISKWDHTLRYPKAKLIPKITQTHKVKKGLVLFTEGVYPADFSLQLLS